MYVLEVALVVICTRIEIRRGYMSNFMKYDGEVGGGGGW